jgi:hypothetical protein
MLMKAACKQVTTPAVPRSGTTECREELMKVTAVGCTGTMGVTASD